MFNSETTIHPTLQHIGITTGNLDRLVDWYQMVLGMWVVARVDNPYGGEGGIRGAWLTNDVVNHRFGIIEFPGLTADPDRAGHHRLQHVAFAYETLDDLLGSYLRLKQAGIRPVLATNQGVQTAFYYDDPDHNSVELNVLNYDSHLTAIEHFQHSAEFKKRSIGVFVDPDQLVAARERGESPWGIHKRAWAGDFSPETPYDVRVLM
jgi:catechol 2,3-dioxygenase